MSISYGGDNITFPDGSTQNTSPQTGFVNRIINGAMTIDQRNAGAAVTTSGAFPVDRFIVQNATDGTFSAQRDTTAPTGFINSLKVTITAADAALAAAQNMIAFQVIEGSNVSDLGWGTANAQAITLSFWVRSSLTGTFGGAFRNSAADRSYPFTYTINAANTFEYKTISIAGDTTGTWLTTNGVGVLVSFSLGAGTDRSGTAGAWAAANYLSATGATSVVGTSGATLYITGVQLEKGSTATPFEFRSIGQELALCQRYYQIVAFVCTAVTTGEMGGSCFFQTTMRANPSLNSTLRIAPSYTGADNFIVRYGVGGLTVGSATFNSVNTNFFGAVLCSGLTVGGVYGASTTASAEL